VSADLPGADAELATLVRLLWRDEHQHAVRVVAGAPPPGFAAVERYHVVPGLARARMLLPGTPSVRAAALSHYNRLRGRRTRAARAGLALLARSGLDARLGATVSVCLPGGTTPDEQADLLVTSMLARRLGRARLHAAVGIGHSGPNRKPTLQLFDDEGRPVAFVKVGWNRLTRGLVAAEAHALDTVDDDALPGIHRPRPLLHEQWHSLTLLATAPMPLDVAPLPASAAPESTVHQALPRLAAPLGGSPFWDGVLERWRGLRELAGTPPRDVAAVDAYVGSVERRWSGASVELGAWHGDWVPWNMARRGDELWVWDWEHYAPMAPIGFDGAHLTFQQSFVAEQQPAGVALDRVGTAPADGCSQAGVVAATYPLELYLRAARLHAHGGGWNERFHDDAVAWLASAAQR
jgi:hypothetical protein